MIGDWTRQELRCFDPVSQSLSPEITAARLFGLSLIQLFKRQNEQSWLQLIQIELCFIKC